MTLRFDVFTVVIFITKYRKTPIREFYLERILGELGLSHDEVRAANLIHFVEQFCFR